MFLGVIVERMFKNGWGSLGSASIGFLTQIIALHLAAQGDTMEMMRAVLDSNFWLATHVVTVTGYSATFLSGALGVVFILRVLSKSAGWGRSRPKFNPHGVWHCVFQYVF
ncbi:MAG: hypothetical protein IPN19_04575 [Elusimicrobia bacterium]|nr:hypothetical protein [Elusimicrobiota bacterium]